MHREKGDFVSASELAQLGACERVVRLEALHGRRRTPAQREAAARGIAEHARFYSESQAIIAASERKGQCFIATLSLGEGDDTRTLRAYRDLVLRRSLLGRWLIGLYYAAGPAMCSYLRRHPRTMRVTTVVLRWVAGIARRAVAKRLEG